MTKYEVVEEVRTVGLCMFVAVDGGNFWGRKKSCPSFGQKSTLVDVLIADTLSKD